jgi:regulator of sigma E protease
MAIVFAIIIFSFLIFIHELGHFLAAKASGVQVNEFAMFMGPAIVKWQRGETLYSIRCIPLGGYCAMEGEDSDTDNPRSFQKAAWWKRLGILLAGAAMNFVSGFLIFALVLAPADGFAHPVIAEAEVGNTIVYEEGLHLGDRILKIDGNRVFVASDATMLFNLNDGKTHDIVLKRNGQKVELQNFVMERHEFSNDDGSSSMRYGIRFGYAEKTFGNLVSYTWNNCLSVVQSVKLSLQMLLSGQAGLNDVAGPVGIVQMMNTTAQASPTAWDAILNLLYFGAFIAVNLAVMNLLPIPALDGGRAVALLLTVIVEKIIGRKIDPKYEGYIHAAGMVLLLAFMAVVMFKDIFVIFKG